MKPRRQWISLLLAAAVLVGQWLAAAHDVDHGPQPGAAHACAICVYSHGSGAGLLPAVAAIEIGGVTAVPEVRAARNPLTASVRNHPIRGPPAILA